MDIHIYIYKGIRLRVPSRGVPLGLGFRVSGLGFRATQTLHVATDAGAQKGGQAASAMDWRKAMVTMIL